MELITLVSSLPGSYLGNFLVILFTVVNLNILQISEQIL